MTPQQQAFLDRLDANIARGQTWLCATTPSERQMALRMVEQQVLDTTDGYVFERYDPEWYAFVRLLEDTFLAQHAPDPATAARYAQWCIGRALFDGQGGWNMTFKRHPRVWDAALAAQMAADYHRFHILDDE